jgi:hypothetical protein
MNTQAPQIPAGMTAVTKEQFFGALLKARNDIMPNHAMPYECHWGVTGWGATETWGWSAPGWKNPGAHPAIYAVRRATAAAIERNAA